MLKGRTEKAISREELLKLLENTPEYLALTDKDANIIFMSIGGRKMLGYGEDEDLSFLTVDQVHSEQANKTMVPDAWNAMVKNGSWEGELEMRHRDGHAIPVWLVAFITRKPNGEIDKVAGIARDISKDKEAARLLHERMEEIQKMNTMLTDRELRMIELKKETGELRKEVKELREKVEKLEGPGA